MTISERIFQILDERGMSQRELCNLTGIAKSTVSDWKVKHTNPSAEQILPICNALHISADELLSGTVPSGKKTKPKDYIVISADSKLGDFIAAYNSMDSNSQNRLLSYFSTLKKSMPEK